MGGSQSLLAGTTTINPTRYIEGDELRNAPSIQAPQSMLVNRGEYGTQVQLMINQDRLFI